MPGSNSDDYDWYYPADISGIGSMHDLDDKAPLPRLYGLKSVSRAACWALQDLPAKAQRPAGFVRARH